MPDLWPDQLDDVADSLPVSFLLEQADRLAQRTNNIIKAEIIPLQSSEDDGESIFRFDFDLVVPAIAYRFTLFTFAYGVEGYPVYFLPYSKICEELDLSAKQVGSSPLLQRALKADDEESLLDALGRILRSHTTKNILQTLIAQAKKFKK